MTASAKLRVLIAEDSAEGRERLVELLGQVPGVEIAGEAEDEARAFALYDQHQPEAAVLDIRLRAGSGITVLEHIRRRDRRCMVIMLTNFDQIDFRCRCGEAGADCFFEKSREFHQGAVALREFVHRRLAIPE